MARNFTVGADVDIDMGANPITNVEDPTNDQDAATKKYVDDNGGSVSVTDGSTTVDPATSLDFTSGATVTDGGGGVAEVAVTSSFDLPGTIHAATGKTTPVDNDELALVDSAASNVLKKLLWSNVKATLKTYFDTLYTASGSGAFVQLSRTVLASDTTFDISGISGAFNHLLLEINVRSDQASTPTILMRFNNDNGAHYNYANMAMTSGGFLTAAAADATSARIGAAPPTGAEAGDSAVVTLTILDYAQTNWKKSWTGTGGRVEATSAGNVIHESPFGLWDDTSAITRIQVFPSAGSFKTNGTLTIYGLL